MQRECSLRWRRAGRDLKSLIGVSHNAVWRMSFHVYVRIEMRSFFYLNKFNLCYLII
jgi:hypothetical protein